MELYANYHTHTFRCGHAKGTDREYVEKAIEAGIKVLGFSDHSPMIFRSGHYSSYRMKLSETDGYFYSLGRLKEEYKNDIELHIGLEAEYYPETHESFMDFMKQFPCEFLLLGQHFIMREEDGIYSCHETRDLKRLQLFYENLKEAVKTGDFLYIAHPDVLNFKGSDSEYYSVTKEFLTQIEKYNIPLEINRLGFYEKRHYPRAHFWKICGETANRAVIGVDAHEPQAFSDAAAIEGCKKFAEKSGVKLVENNFLPL